MAGRRLGSLLLVASLGVLLGGWALVLAFAPDRLWLLVFPPVLSAGLFLVWAARKLKDPSYYG